MVKTHSKELALELRKSGHSYNYIASVLGISKSTLSGWLANVPYTPNTETIDRIGKARAASGAVKSRLKLESIELARKEAFFEIMELSQRDLFMLGLGLYIGEGDKSLSNTRIVNSNPDIMRFMIRWFTQALGLSVGNIRIRLHIYPDTDEEKSINFWSDALKIPRLQFQRSCIDIRTDKKPMKAGKLPYGTAHMSIKSLGEKRFGVFLARKIMAWSDIVLNRA